MEYTTINELVETAKENGMVIAKRASVSGAQGGCQAECGSAAAMTAAALTEIMGGTPQQAADACAIALKNQLGLCCCWEIFLQRQASVSFMTEICGTV